MGRLFNASASLSFRTDPRSHLRRKVKKRHARWTSFAFPSEKPSLEATSQPLRDSSGTSKSTYLSVRMKAFINLSHVKREFEFVSRIGKYGLMILNLD